MDIRLVSSLTDDDEDRFAPVLLQAIAELLGTVPVAYSLRIDTSAGRTLQHSRSIADVPTRQDVIASLATLTRRPR